MTLNKRYIRFFFYILLNFQDLNKKKTIRFLINIKRDYIWNQWIRQGGLLAFFQFYLNKTGIEELKAPFFSQKEMAANLIKKYQTEAILRQLRKLLKNNNILFALLKGYLYGEIYYPHPGLRSYGDLDIYIFPPHKDRALEILLENNWLLKHQSKAAQGDHYTLSKNGYVLEIHWNIALRNGSAPLFSVPEKILKQELKIVSLNNNSYFTFSPEIHFIHSALNWLKKKGWPPAKYLDLYFLYLKCDKNKLIKIARKANMFLLITYFIIEVNIYFYKKKSFHKTIMITGIENHKHTGKPLSFIDCFYMQFFFSETLLEIIYHYIRNLFPTKKYLNSYYGNKRKKLILWWTNKMRDFFRKV